MFKLRRSYRLLPMFRPNPEPLNLSPSAISRMFPLEIVASFMDHCQPNELCVLSTICRSWNGEAERLLYANVYLGEEKSAQMWSCLKELVKNPRRAALVRSFDLHHPAELDRKLLKKICAVLPALTSITHLGLMIYPLTSMLRSLSAAVKRCTFTLTSVSVTIGLWPLDWIEPRFGSLRAVILWQCSSYTIARLLPDLHKHLTLDTTHLICTTHHLSRSHEPDLISVFPGFAPRLASWDPYFVKDLFCASNNTNAENVMAFQIYLKNLSDPELLRRILQPIANIFQRITKISIYVQVSDISNFTREISATFSQFKLLKSLNFEPWSPGIMRPIYQITEGECNHMAAAWAGDIPKLNQFRLPNGMLSVLKGGTWEAAKTPPWGAINLNQFFMPV